MSLSGLCMCSSRLLLRVGFVVFWLLAVAASSLGCHDQIIQ